MKLIKNEWIHEIFFFRCACESSEFSILTHPEHTVKCSESPIKFLNRTNKIRHSSSRCKIYGGGGCFGKGAELLLILVSNRRFNHL
uniref:Uncharacterized protein n=1 Tax=Caenorhabditis tropicalis TaxID=1561998 RepID=A0A1I7V0E6_9PELO